MEIALYLQIISIPMAVIAVATPAFIAIVGFVYVRRMTDRIDNIAAEVNELWDRVKLETLVRSSTAAQRDAVRARIVLLAAQGHRNDQIQALRALR